MRAALFVRSDCGGFGGPEREKYHMLVLVRRIPGKYHMLVVRRKPGTVKRAISSVDHSSVVWSGGVVWCCAGVRWWEMIVGAHDNSTSCTTTSSKEIKKHRSAAVYY